MRNLTVKQKKLMTDFITSQLTEINTFARTQSFFKNGKSILSASDLPPELYQKIESINDTEILYQNIERFMCDESFKISWASAGFK